MSEHTVPQCHGVPMRQVVVNYTNPLSYQYRCETCLRTERVTDPPISPVSVAEFLRSRGLIEPDENLSVDQLQARLNLLASKPIRDSER